MGTRKINIPGKGPTEVVEVGYRPLQEYWSEYHLDDGTTIRMKLVVTAVYKVPDEWDQDGNPAYFLTSANVVTTNSPDNLRRPEETP